MQRWCCPIFELYTLHFAGVSQVAGMKTLLAGSAGIVGQNFSLLPQCRCARLLVLARALHRTLSELTLLAPSLLYSGRWVYLLLILRYQNIVH